MSFMLSITQKNNLTFLAAENLLRQDWLVHAFTTRPGGISRTQYSSLNLYGNHSEEYQNCLENRKILGETLGFAPEKLVLAQQVHGNQVKTIGEKESGRGALSHQTAIPETDALITNIPGTPLLLLYADCLPILLADCKKKVVGVVHAGWKGTAKQILSETLKKFQAEYHSDFSDLQIAFGVGISDCCFEIGWETKAELEKVSYSEQAFGERNGKIYANLVEINKSQALKSGVPQENICLPAGFCSFCQEELFYSYRRDQQNTGRHGALIFIS